MSDPRAETVRRFREDQAARQVYILTVLQPFTISQNRFILLEWHKSAQLIHCADCTPRTALGSGQVTDIEADTLQAFTTALDGARDAWDSDLIPSGLHDGITVTIERCDDDGYWRSRMVNPPEGSAHDRLQSAWMAAFPEVALAITQS